MPPPAHDASRDDADADDVPVWLFAPLGRDARLLRGALLERAHPVRIVDDAEALGDALERDEVGVLVMTQEALLPGSMATIERHLDTQAPWEELPVVLLVDASGHTVRALFGFQNALPRCKALVLQRPIRLSELESAVETMRQSRLRQRALRDYIERQELLRRELNHRVKNILATVQALHGLSAAAAPDLASFNDSFEGRLDAMAEVHQVLQDDDYGSTELAAVAGAILAPFGDPGELRIEGDPVTLGPEVAQGLALVLHELSTNASKHGALSGAGGRVRLTWTRAGERFRIVWTERDGPPVTVPVRKGYGTRFIELTMRGYGGTARFDYADPGLEVTLSAPLASVEASPA